MMKSVRKPAPESGKSAVPQHSQFASRPFAQKAGEHEAPVEEFPISFSLADIAIFPRETVQPKLLLGQVGDRSEKEQVKPVTNRTGMPDRLKAGIESLSGIDMSDVRVHANSPKPARLDALAYTQGNQIYLGPGQERHLPHEAWHVVQQKQGRVRSTINMKGMAINDDVALENEADWIATRITDKHTLQKGRKMEKIAPNPLISQVTSLQLMRIRLVTDGKSDRALDLLSEVPLHNEGQRINLMDAWKQQPIAENEDIILEGHGTTEEGQEKVSQVGIFNPAQLAEFIKGIRKPENWRGRIILLGCSSGDIVPKVQNECERLHLGGIEVIGFQYNLRPSKDPKTKAVKLLSCKYEESLTSNDKDKRFLANFIDKIFNICSRNLLAPFGRKLLLEDADGLYKIIDDWLNGKELDKNEKKKYILVQVMLDDLIELIKGIPDNVEADIILKIVNERHRFNDECKKLFGDLEFAFPDMFEEVNFESGVGLVRTAPAPEGHLPCESSSAMHRQSKKRCEIL